MNLKSYRVAMLVIAAAFLAMLLSGCGGDDNGLSPEQQARLDSADDAIEDAEKARMEAAEAEKARMEAEEALKEAQETPAEAPYDPSMPGGTQEGAPGRAAAKRIADAADSSGIMSGVVIKSLEQARLGQTPNLTVAATGATDLSTATDGVMLPEGLEIPGWMGVAMEKSGAGITQHALAYSDAERSVRAFGDVYEYTYMLTPPAADANPEVGPVATATDEESMRTHILVDENIGTTSKVLMGVGAFDSKVSVTHGLSTSTGSLVRFLGSATEPGRTLRGSYAGVPGEYTCAHGADTCTLTLDADGTTVSIVASGGDADLVFKADDAETLLPDADYLAFGAWTLVPDDPSYANPGQTLPFVKASAPAFDSQEIVALTGSAAYNGPAAGHYAIRAQGDHMVKYGRFTATTTITASFDVTNPTTGALAVQNRDADGALIAESFSVVYGTSPGVAFSNSKIHMFKDENGDMMEGWVVNLGGPGSINNSVSGVEGVYSTQELANAALLAATVTNGNMLSGTTSGTNGSQAWSGVWDGSFHGTNMSTVPNGIVGRFQAETGTPRPMTTPEARIDLFNDEGFAGVVGSFAGR